jgi:hypothetical protein
MSNNSVEHWQPPNPERLAKHFTRLGWLGFWIQLILLTIPVFLVIYALFFSSPESAQRKGIDLTHYLSYISLLLMVFTIFWLFRYTRMGKRIADPEQRPSQSGVMRMLWTGLLVSGLAVFDSLLLLMNAVGRMLFVLLATPQTGIALTPIAGEGNPRGTLSAIDAISLSTLVVLLTAELIVMGFTLWLIFKTTQPPAEHDDAVETAN